MEWLIQHKHPDVTKSIISSLAPLLRGNLKSFIVVTITSTVDSAVSTSGAEFVQADNNQNR